MICFHIISNDPSKKQNSIKGIGIFKLDYS